MKRKIVDILLRSKITNISRNTQRNGLAVILNSYFSKVRFSFLKQFVLVFQDILGVY